MIYFWVFENFWEFKILILVLSFALFLKNFNSKVKIIKLSVLDLVMKFFDRFFCEQILKNDLFLTFSFKFRSFVLSASPIEAPSFPWQPKKKSNNKLQNFGCWQQFFFRAVLGKKIKSLHFVIDYFGVSRFTTYLSYCSLSSLHLNLQIT